MSLPSLSVVIACFNGMPFLPDQLDALRRQRYDGDWNVVLADNGSTDGSIAAARAFEHRMPIDVVDASDARGQSHARNSGAAASDAELLVFVDQDDVVADGYLEAMARELADHPMVAARIDTARLNPSWAAEARPMVQAERLGAGLMPYAAGGSLGIRREVFELAGGFDPAMPGAAEDVDLCWRAQLATGEQLAYAPDALLHYRLRTSIRAIAHQAYGHGRAQVALHVRYRQQDRGGQALALARRWMWAAVSFAKHPSRATLARLLWLAAHRAGVVREAVRRRLTSA